MMHTVYYIIPSPSWLQYARLSRHTGLHSHEPVDISGNPAAQVHRRRDGTQSTWFPIQQISNGNFLQHHAVMVANHFFKDVNEGTKKMSNAFLSRHQGWHRCATRFHGWTWAWMSWAEIDGPPAVKKNFSGHPNKSVPICQRKNPKRELISDH